MALQSEGIATHINDMIYLNKMTAWFCQQINEDEVVEISWMSEKIRSRGQPLAIEVVISRLKIAHATFFWFPLFLMMSTYNVLSIDLRKPTAPNFFG